MAKKKPTKKVSQDDRTLEVAISECKAMLTENWPKIISAYKDARDEHPADSEKNFKFNIGLGAVMEQESRSDIKVSAKIGFGIKFKDCTAGTTVSNQPTLPGLSK